MSMIVLRCQNCGTTQAGPGECEACHEAQVAYYCANHSPGHWLKTSTCPQCGAKFGDASPAAKGTPLPPTRPTPVAPIRKPAREEPEPSSPWTRGTARSAASEPVWPRTVLPLPTPVREDPRTAEPDPMSPPLRDILMRGPVADRYPGARRPEAAPPAQPWNAVAGLIRRLMMLAIIFIAAMILLSLFSNGSLLQILLNILLTS